MATRPQAALVKLWPPEGENDGEPKMFSPENANDMCRRPPGKAWSRVAPGTPKRQLQNVEVRNILANGDTMSGILEALRKDAADLGIRWDASWGVARLKTEITNRERAPGAPRVPTTPDEIAAAELKRMADIASKEEAEDDEDARIMAALEAEAAAKAEQALADQKDGPR